MDGAFFPQDFFFFLIFLKHDFAKDLRLASNPQPFCLSLLSSRITGIGYKVQVILENYADHQI